MTHRGYRNHTYLLPLPSYKAAAVVSIQRRGSITIILYNLEPPGLSPRPRQPSQTISEISQAALPSRHPQQDAQFIVGSLGSQSHTHTHTHIRTSIVLTIVIDACVASYKQKALCFLLAPKYIGGVGTYLSSKDQRAHTI